MPSNTSIVIRDGTKGFSYQAFYQCSGLSSITIPDSVVNIGKSAFEGCLSLPYISIPNSVRSIGRGAFMACESMTSVTIPDTVTYIGTAAFGYLDYYEAEFGEEYEYIDGFVIYGCMASAAEDYAYENGIEFYSMEDESIFFD